MRPSDADARVWALLLDAQEQVAAAPAGRMRTLAAEFLARFPGAVDRRHRVGHLAASVQLVTACGGWALLLKHPTYGRWGPVGGHLELDDVSIRAAAAREASEETGQDIDVTSGPVAVQVTPALCRHANPGSVHVDLQYMAVVDRVALRGEHAAHLCWFETDCLPDEMAQGARSLVDAARKEAAHFHARGSGRAQPHSGDAEANPQSHGI